MQAAPKSHQGRFLPKRTRCRTAESVPDDGSLMYVERTHRVLDGVCFHLGDAPVLTSLYRSPAHNARVGGRPTSAHKKGIAFDLSWIGTQVDPLKLVLELRRMGVNNIGLAKTFIHGDLRPGKDRFWWYKGAQDIWTREHGIRGRSDLGLAQ